MPVQYPTPLPRPEARATRRFHLASVEALSALLMVGPVRHRNADHFRSRGSIGNGQHRFRHLRDYQFSNCTGSQRLPGYLAMANEPDAEPPLDGWRREIAKERLEYESNTERADLFR